MGPGAISAFTRVFEALWAGTTEIIKFIEASLTQTPVVALQPTEA